MRRILVAVGGGGGGGGGGIVIISSVGAGGERAGLEVFYNKKTGKSGGEEYQNQPQWAHC